MVIIQDDKAKIQTQIVKEWLGGSKRDDSFSHMNLHQSRP